MPVTAIDDDIPPEMPPLDDELLDSLVIDEASGEVLAVGDAASDDLLADVGPPPPLVPPPAAPPAGEQLPPPPPKTTTRTGALLSTPAGSFRILRRIAAGGMGEVFQARRVGTASFAKEVALKRIVTSLKRDDATRRMFVAEARLAALLTHPKIAAVFDLIELDSSYLLVMEYLPGASVKELHLVAQTKGTLLSAPFAIFIAAEIAEALAYAHVLTVDGKPLGIVHRDVSPHNILVTDTGDVKLLDFGVALSSLDGRDKTSTGIVKGKVNYMSPEQASGLETLDSRSDQFSLAIVLVELLTGKRIFDAGASETRALMQIATCPPHLVEASLKELPAPLAALLTRALKKDPAERFPTCLHFAEALRDYLLEQKLRFGARQAIEEVARLRSLPDALPTKAQRPPPAPGPTPVRPPPPPPNSSSHSLPAPSTVADMAPASPTAIQRLKRTQEALYSPPAAKRSGYLLPLGAFAALMIGGFLLVRVLTTSAAAPQAAAELVKTPAQERAERALQERELTSSVPPPALPDPAVTQAQPLPATAALGSPAAPAEAPAAAKHSRAAAAPHLQPHEAPASAAPPPAPAVAQEAAPAPPAPRPVLRPLSTRMSAGSSAAPPGATSALGVPRGTQLAARLEGVADPNAPGTVAASLTQPLELGGRPVLPKGAHVVCETGTLSGTRLSLSCDTISAEGRSFTFAGAAYGVDGRPGLPVSVTPGTSNNAAGAAVATGERVARSLRPSGVVGELVDGVTDAASQGARTATSPTAPTAGFVSGGTPFVIVVTQNF